MSQIEEQHLKPVLIEQSFNDFDLFLDSIQDWDLEFYKLDKAPFNTKIRRIISTNVSLVDVKLISRLDQNGHSLGNGNMKQVEEKIIYCR